MMGEIQFDARRVETAIAGSNGGGGAATLRAFLGRARFAGWRLFAIGVLAGPWR